MGRWHKNRERGIEGERKSRIYSRKIRERGDGVTRVQPDFSAMTGTWP
jgi:hypothetical protein